MEIHRLGVKFFAADPAIPSTEFIPIFHGWIQRQVIDGPLLVDVHNYSHIHQGPGILLVAHEGNFSTDMAGGRLGLHYYRKQPGSLADAVKTTLQACVLLEDDINLEGRLRFRTDEFLIITNDRLHSSNDEETFLRLKPPLAAAIERTLGGTNFTMSRVSQNPKECLSVRVQTGKAASAKTLLDRM